MHSIIRYITCLFLITCHSLALAGVTNPPPAPSVAIKTEDPTTKVVPAEIPAPAQSSTLSKSKEETVNKSTAFFEENKKKPGVVTLPSGLQYHQEKAGAGQTAGPSDFVVVHYRGKFLNGTEFDSSYKRNEPATFAVNSVIPGWTEALQLMKPGAKWTLFIPPNLAYGEKGIGPIGPNEPLVFDIELISVKSSSFDDEQHGMVEDTEIMD
jgi:FKBP-type peptidyl-prolyl cis-trans isomerase